MPVLHLLVLYILYFFNSLFALPYYHQDDYNVVLERFEILWYNSSYAENVTTHCGWYNRTRRAFNGSFYLLHDLGREITAVLQFYKFMSNEYRYFPMRVSVNLCDEYERNNFKAKELLKGISNAPERCPLKRGLYWVKSNGRYPDFSTLPPFIPRGRYKANVQVYYKNAFVGEGNSYGAVNDKPMEWH